MLTMLMLVLILGLVGSGGSQQILTGGGLAPVTRPPTSCESYQATCNNGDCIDKSQICDGREDCSDGSDESGCRESNVCEPNEYQCDNKKCVLKTWRCDGDDDCGDGSDEANCLEADPNSNCRYYEWECKSGDQCIPKSFHCDGEVDCQDQTDEIGCIGPEIVVSPPAAVPVDQSYTFIINCTAIGIPTPEIVWRLNWGHVPDKCSMSNEVLDGNKVFGELSCPNAIKEDSGAYSCEAINSMGTCFAGSAGCGQPGQDAIVVVNAGGSTCPRGSFNREAASDQDCLACYCSGLTDVCSSADLYTSQLPPPAGIFQLVSRDPSTLTITQIRSVRPSMESSASQRLRVESGAGLQRTFTGIPFVSLPQSHTGNQIRSYGGYLRFNLAFEGQGEPMDEPMVILQGEDMTLSFYLPTPPVSGSLTRVEARFWPGQWFTDYRNGNRATRQDVLRVLGGLKQVLVRAQQTDNAFIDSTVSDIVMDTALSRDSGFGSASYVEQCVCPPGYTGLSCQQCAPGFERSESGSCRKPSQMNCPSGYYTDPDSGECQICPCPLTIPSNQFGRECRVDSDRQVTCVCGTGYTGRRCGECAPGYVGNPAVPGGSCTPGPACNFPDGSLDPTPNPATGRCRCKAGYTGDGCRQAALTGCGQYEFLSLEESAPGCLNCFCSGIPTGYNRTTCRASQLNRYKERAVFLEDNLGFTLVNNYFEELVDSSSLSLDSSRQEISFDRFEDFPETVFFWNLPFQFLGNKVTSYGGYLEFRLSYVPVPGAEERPDQTTLLELQGNDITLFHDSEPVQRDENGHRFKVRLHEEDWRREDGGASNREHLIMALADLDHILIRARHNPGTRQAGIADVSLDCAVNRTTEGGRASAVEGCLCPAGYKGLSCEECAPGYTRSGSGLYLGTCQPCNCNGKSTTCDPETGVCLDCRDYTTGDNCEGCAPGYVKDYTGGGCVPLDGDRQPCACDPRGSEDLTCEDQQFCRCKENVEGNNCNRCKPGTFSLDVEDPKGCRKCYCSGVTDECGDARLFWSTLRLFPNMGYAITDKTRGIFKERDVFYDAEMRELVYRDDIAGPTVYYWQLPQEVTGNRMGAYGGNLTVIQRYTGGGRILDNEPAVILVGGSGLTLEYPEDRIMRTEGEEAKFKVTLAESVDEMVGWMVQGQNRPASREEILQALSNIQAILVRATTAEGMDETRIRKTMLDIAVPQMTGGPMVVGSEECRCPAGYAGLSCEACALGYYRDWSDNSLGDQGRCKVCPCSGNEDNCSMMSNGEVECTCKVGYSGRSCEQRVGEYRPPPVPGPNPGSEVPITISMTEPRIQIVEVGNTVRFNCNAMPRFITQDPTSIVWARENGLLPADRATDDGRGLLVITSVRAEDSGTYVCTATVGRFVKTETAVLNVAGQDAGAVPAVTIDPPYAQVGEGEQLQLQCRGSGSPVYSWTRGRGQPLQPSAQIRGPMLYIGSVVREDEGEYVCTATNSAGSAQTRAQVYVASREGGGSQPSGREPEQPGGLAVSPQDLAISIGDTAMFSCEVQGSAGYQVSWQRLDGRLPFTASDYGGRLTISDVKPEDSGMYVCRAQGGSGSLEAQARLTVTSLSGPPTVRIEPDEQTIGQGSSTEVRCIASGSPQPSIEWTKVGEDMSSPNIVLNGGNLILKNAAVSDRGMYLCTAQNSGGSARASAIIEVERRETPSIDIYPESTQTITKGGSVLFQCRTISGIPTPVVSWTRVDGKPMSSNVENLDGGVLRINRVTGSEEGQYRCRAQNEVGSTESIATLIVQEVPSIQLQPSGSVTMQVGTKLSISCNVRGDPTPTIVWRKLGATTVELGERSATYEVPSLRKEDEGTYACVATNEAGETEERVQIIVLEENEYFPYPENNQGTGNPDNSGGRYPDNSGGRYPDNSGGRYPDNSGGRYPDNSGGRYPDNSGGRYPDNSGGRYPDNSGGRYPENSGGRYPDNSGGRYPDNSGGRYPDNSGGQIAGQNDGQFSSAAGSNVQLTCLTVGSAADLTAQWRRTDNQPFKARHSQQGGILNLVDIDASDEAEYVCEVTDNRGTLVYEVRKEVKLLDPPRISLDPERQTVVPGQSASIYCSATGKGPISLRWDTETGAQLPASVYQRDGLLQFSSISVGDQGRYQCTASNADGRAVATAEVIVNDYGNQYSSNDPEQITGSLGASVDLPCRLAGGGGEVSWRREGGPLPPNAVQIRTVLRIDRVTDQDSGRYVCSSQAGEQYVDLRIERIQPMRQKPTVVVTGSVPRPYAGGSLDLSCKLDRTQETRNITWKRVGSELADNVRTRGNLIRFVGLESSNEGLYRCTIETEAGIFYSDYNLHLLRTQGYGLP